MCFSVECDLCEQDARDCSLSSVVRVNICDLCEQDARECSSYFEYRRTYECIDDGLQNAFRE